MKCPRCNDSDLTKKNTSSGLAWGCEKCNGRYVGMALLRKVVEPAFLTEVWQSARKTSAVGAQCPSCQKAMSLIPTPLGYNLDVCSACHAIWFDRGEHPPKVSSPTKSVRSEGEVRVAQAFAVSQTLAKSEKSKWESWERLATLLSKEMRWYRKLFGK